MSLIERAGVRLFYEVEGEGFPIVLHAGAGGDSGMFLDAGYVEGLAGFQSILFDHRGHGRSARPRTLDAHRMDEYVADVVALADELGLSRFAFIGYSDGARVGYAVASAHPERVAALVALGTVDGPDERPEERLAEARELRARGIDRLVDELKASEPEVPAWFEARLRATDTEMFALELAGWADWSLWPLLERITAPTLIVAGTEEDAGCAEAAACLRNGTAVILPGLGHLGAFTASNLVLTYVLPFVRENCLRPASASRLEEHPD